MQSRISQTAKGKAFEYSCLIAIANNLDRKHIGFVIKKDRAYNTAFECFNLLDNVTKQNYMCAAETALKTILHLEPRIEDCSAKDLLELFINKDSAAKGKKGDVRDVICLRNEQGWQVGFSCKHNHEALKHPRLTIENSKNQKDFAIADFGSAWIGYPCSDTYFKEMGVAMEVIKGHLGEKWSEAFGDKSDKQDLVYVPVLQIVLKEIRKICSECADAPEKLLSYFFGSNDFYKIISFERQKITKVVAFNMNGTLNSPSRIKKSITKIPKLLMPSRLIEARFKEKSNGEMSKTTIVLVFDHGWTINMRLHSGDKTIKASGLKFDVSLEGNPHGIFQQQRSWLE